MKTFIFPISELGIKNKLGFREKQMVYSFIQMNSDSERLEFITDTRNYINMFVLNVHMLVFYIMTCGEVIWIKSNESIKVGIWFLNEKKHFIMDTQFEYMDFEFKLEIHKKIVTVKNFTSHSFHIINQHQVDKNYYLGILMIPIVS